MKINLKQNYKFEFLDANSCFVSTYRLLVLEEIIADDARASCWYAVDALGGRFELGEEAISKDSEYAFEYARNIIRVPWPMGEAAIATDTSNSYWYAYLVIKGRFELGEEAIAKSANYYPRYISRFLGKKK